MINIQAIKKAFYSIRAARWERQKFSEILSWSDEFNRIKPTHEKNGTQLTFVCEEFFHEELGGYGGFGMTVKNIAQHFNTSHQSDIAVSLAIPQGSKLVSEPGIRTFHETTVVLRPQQVSLQRDTFIKYSAILESLKTRALITIDWYPSYENTALAASDTPIILWIHDPRDRQEWDNIAAISEELKFRGIQSRQQLIAFADEKHASISRLKHAQKTIPRKIVFATTAQTLVPRAERTYGIAPIAAHWLPNPINIPKLEKIEYSATPTVLYLGRLDAVKRPWMVFELAKRHPSIIFQIAGKSHRPDLSEIWMSRYKNLPNLQLLGHIDGEAKDRLLRSCWGLINTSVHEAEPVSFLEAFAYGRAVIACHDPDHAVTNFGYYTGEVLGEGLDEKSLQQFDTQLVKLVSDHQGRLSKGLAGRAEMVKNHTFESFYSRLIEILEKEKI